MLIVFLILFVAGSILTSELMDRQRVAENLRSVAFMVMLIGIGFGIFCGLRICENSKTELIKSRGYDIIKKSGNVYLVEKDGQPEYIKLEYFISKKGGTQ